MQDFDFLFEPGWLGYCKNLRFLKNTLLKQLLFVINTSPISDGVERK